MSQNSTRITYHQHLGISPEEACDARARAWAYVFSWWHAKQKDMPPQTPGEHPNGSAAKEVSYVEHSSNESSSFGPSPIH